VLAVIEQLVTDLTPAMTVREGTLRYQWPKLQKAHARLATLLGSARSGAQHFLRPAIENFLLVLGSYLVQQPSHVAVALVRSNATHMGDE
jgi:hypothetical protein